MSATPRLVALDAARGFAVVAMILFHLIWDLAHFGYIEPGIPWSAPVKAFGHSIAFSFLFIAGVSLTLAHRNGVRWGAFWRRFAIVAGAAALVSAGTYIVFPSAFVFFGILHCIAAASVIALPFLGAPWPAAIAAATCFLAGPALFASPVFNSNWLQWLGLSTTEPLTQDWRPLFPWAGALLLGVAMGRLPLPVYGERAGVRGEGVSRKFSLARPETSTAFPSWSEPQAPHPDPLPASGERELAFLGRHSLLVYLAHQPALFAMFTALTFVAPAPDEAVSFVAACETRCVDEGGVKEACRAICACTVKEATNDPALTTAKDDAERGRALNEIARRCAAARE